MSKSVDREVRAALAAGWSRNDLRWERLQEFANRACIENRRGRASGGFVLAALLALTCFRDGDPRRIASLANFAFVVRRFGVERSARHLYGRAGGQWTRVERSLESIEIRPRARSSLFHMRMEALHRERYEENMRLRLGRFVQETAECLDCLMNAEPVPHRLFERWRGEKPYVFDDTRKVLAACLLVASETKSG